MSKASARHVKQGKDSKKIAAKVAARKEANRLAQQQRELENARKCAELRISLDGRAPSAALRAFYRSGQRSKSKPKPKPIYSPTIEAEAKQVYRPTGEVVEAEPQEVRVAPSLSREEA